MLTPIRPNLSPGIKRVKLLNHNELRLDVYPGFN
jgi:hypothetical protein